MFLGHSLLRHRRLSLFDSKNFIQKITLLPEQVVICLIALDYSLEIMKQILLIGLIALSLLTVNCGGNMLAGKYQRTDKTNGGYLELTNDQHFTLYFQGSPPQRGTYQTDDGKSPKQIVLAMDTEKTTDASDAGKGPHSTGIYQLEGAKLMIKLANGTDVNALYPADFRTEPAYVTMQYERFDGQIPANYQ